MGMTISSGIEAVLLMLLGVTAVFLMVRVAARAYRDKPQVWRGQAFLSGWQGADGRSRRREPAAVNGGADDRSEGRV
jgi:hypothetical protein